MVNSSLSLICVISIKTLSAQKAKFNPPLFGEAASKPVSRQDRRVCKHSLRQVCPHRLNLPQTPLTERHQTLEICILRFDVRPAAENFAQGLLGFREECHSRREHQLDNTTRKA